MNVKLWDVEQTLEDLMDQGAQAELDGDHEAALVFYQQLDEYLTREAAKVTSYVGLIRSREATVAAAKLERDRIDGIMKRAQADVDRMKATALAVMQRFDVKELRATPGGGLRRQKNGGVEPLEIGEIQDLPRKYVLASVSLPEWIWDGLLELAQAAAGKSDTYYVVERAFMARQQGADKEAIREALKQRVVCRAGCHEGTTGDGAKCPACGGKGTVQATIPGATLKPRGEHVKVI